MRGDNYRLARRGIIPTVMLLAALSVPGLAMADKACDFPGSWYGYLPSFNIDFIGTAHGAAHGFTNAAGTYTLEVPGLDLTYIGFPFPGKISTFRGTWERVDKRTIAFTFVGFGVDAFGQTVVIAKLSGIDTFSEDCNSITIQNTIELFAPGQDPFGEDDPAYGSFPAGIHSASRMRVDPPATS